MVMLDDGGGNDAGDDKTASSVEWISLYTIYELCRQAFNVRAYGWCNDLKSRLSWRYLVLDGGVWHRKRADC
jgi:hypothetical protein